MMKMKSEQKQNSHSSDKVNGGALMTVEVWFFDNSYREHGPPYGTTYRPHFVIKESSEYLGIQFESLEKASYGEHILCDIKLLYDGVDYSNLVSGVVFEIREGPHTVGEGVVK